MECDVSLKDRPNHPERPRNYEMASSKNYQTPPLLTTQQLPSTHNQKCNHQSANYDTDRPPVLQPEDEDPLAFDELAIDSSLRLDSPPKLVKHTHCLRRHVPRLNAKLTTEKSPSSSEKSEKLTRSSSAQASTMREVLASIPGFSLKPRRRSNKKMSTAAQIEQTKDGKIDLETPDSVLVGTNLRALLNKHTFSLLPPLFQHNLVQLLPSVDRPPVDCDPSLIRLSASSLNNEFFARACLEWRDRLSEGEFTPENQVKLKTEAEKEKSKLDPWKLKHFEPIWGSKQDQPSHKTTIKLNPPTSLESSSTPSTSSGVFGSPSKSSIGETNTIPQPSTSNSPKRLRTVGAITRAQQQQALVSSSEASQKTITVRKEKDECDSGIEEIVAETAEKVVQSNRPVEISQMNKILASESKALGEDVENSYVSSETNEEVLFEIEVSSVDTTSETTTQSGENSLQNLAEKKSSRACNDESSLKFNELELEKNENSITASSSCDTKGNDRYSDDNDNAAAEPFDEKTCNSLDLASKLDLSKHIENRKDGDELLLTDYQQTGSHTSTSEIDRGASDHLFADMYKLQNFNGLLQNAFNIQNTSMFGNHQQQQSASSHITQQNIHQIPTSSSHDIVESFIVSDLASDGGIGAMLTCSEETTSSTSGLVDCSADNTAIDELEPSIQNLPIEDDPIEQKFADAENYVLESGNNEDYSSLQKRAPKRSSSPEYNDGKQLKLNESVDRQENENSTTQVSADQKHEILLEMRYSDSDNAETLDEKTCQTVDLDGVKFDLGGEILYSIESDKIDPDDILSSEYHHGENNANQVGISTIDATERSKTTENLFADMYKLQNFNGLLHNAFNVQQNFGHQIHHPHQQAVQQMSHQMPTSSSAQDCIVESFIVSDLVNSGGSGGGSSGSVGAMLTCSDETSSSTSGLVDCSGDNSADDNAIEELEQSIQNIPIEDDPIEQKFADAEHYVMESGEISTDSGEASSLVMTDTNKMREETVYSDSIEQAIPSTATMTLVRNSNVDAAISNYDLQHIDQKRQQQQMAMCTTSSTSLSTCSVSISGNSSSSSSSSSMSSSSAMPEATSKVDIYQHVAHDWNFGMKIESNQSDMGGIDTAPDEPLLDNQNQCSDEIVGHLDDSNTVRDTGNIYHNHLHNQHRQTLFETASNEQIKTENEMPMTAAEMEVSSTVASNSNDSSSDQSINEAVHSGKIMTQPTNNFIVHQMHQPNLAFQQNSAGAQQQIQNCNNSQLTGQYVSQLQQQVQPQMTFNFHPQQQANIQQHYIENQQRQQQIQNNIQMPLNPLQQQQQVVNKLTQKSSTIPATNMQQQRNPANIPSAYLSLSSSQPLKVIPNVVNNPGIPTTIAQQRPKLPPTSGKGRRSSNKLPPGAVNLERSYQICQAVIQNSPNRHQLTAQLRPPASLLAANSGSSSSASNSNSPTLVKKDVPPAVTSSNRTMYKVIGPRLKKYAQRQPSPTSLVRHVYATSPNGTVPGNPALPMGIHQQSGQLQGISAGQQQQQQQQQSALIQGQYVLIHRANVGAADNQAPRASSAPPAQNQQIHGVNGVPISGRGRPASVDVDSPNTLHEIQMAGPNPGIQAVTRRTINNQGLSYGDPIMDPSHQNYMVNTGGENSPPNCPCSLNPMVICQQCGAFCHDDCISPAKLCVACVIR